MKNKRLILICCLFFMLFICNSVFARMDARPKACKSNIRVIMGAVEMYNMDNSDFITKVDDETIRILIKGNYLKAVNKPDPKCQYKSMGNLSEDGIIYCVYHGDIDGLVKCEYYGFDEYEKLLQDINDQEFKVNIGRIREIRKAELERRERENNKRNRLGYVASIVAILCFIIDSILFCVLIFRWLKAIIQSLKNKIDWKS